MTSSDHEADPTQVTQGYAAQVEALTRARKVSFVEYSLPGATTFTQAGEGTVQRLPLSATVDGSPMDVLFTVSVGATQDSEGEPLPVDPSRVGGAANAVTMAAKNYAVVRAPYSSEQPRLLELTAEDIATGQCNFQSGVQPAEGQPTRLFAPVPSEGETPLHVKVPVTADLGEAPAHLIFQMSQPNELQLDNIGAAQSYAMVAAQV